MAQTFYITTEDRPPIRLTAIEGDDQQVSIDFSSWAEDNAALTTATWSVTSGSATVDGESLTSSVATARITTASTGSSNIKLSATDGTRTKVVYIKVRATKPFSTAYDYDFY